jgi:hypothetical protein
VTGNTATMQRYVGTKYLRATPMTLGEYNRYRAWQQPSGEDPAAPGYLVEYEDGGTPNHAQHKGYISWSPKAVFERHYHLTSDTGASAP